MKGREAKTTSSTDLLVCFPSGIQLALMHNPICSPGRTQDHNNRRHNNRHHHLKKSSTTRSIGQASPLIWTNAKSEITEPTSPKVNCAGKIKVIRPKTTATTKSWQSVMEEIEKIHSNNKHKKRSKLALSLSFKKEVMHLLTCLSCMRLDLRCFGTLNHEGEDDEDIEDEGYGEKENHVVIEENDNETSGTVFSKWLMVLQENKTNELHKEDTNNGSSVEEAEEAIVPPSNALLLMRCRSAPVKSLWKEKEDEKSEEQNEQGKDKEKVAWVNKGKSLKSLMEENRKKENLVVMRYDSDIFKISSSEIAKNTWIVGGLRDSVLPKSRSCNK
ncbi:hypothetical protein Lal_00030474 [Lupinus albus]|uniref:Uncharacterized protein n=1 Tax=Lupinus albus TaxID=3870 RepID=A0A6A5LX94_LUPAL|nr:hypothetical protein Lalb_Chr17g0344141 [Lupinus albus]KAF1863445.1 hypothetical protein Lal_00030474 [Lupinus albus]